MTPKTTTNEEARKHRDQAVRSPAVRQLVEHVRTTITSNLTKGDFAAGLAGLMSIAKPVDWYYAVVCLLVELELRGESKTWAMDIEQRVHAEAESRKSATLLAEDRLRAKQQLEQKLCARNREIEDLCKKNLEERSNHAFLTGRNKELARQVDDLSVRIADLESENRQLRVRVAKIQIDEGIR